MSAEHVLTMLNEHEVKFVDLRFTDTKGKNSTSLSLLIR
ncbi:glutamine synthetase [Escherichia coli]|uniref:Glutamine synthetase n=1 Tax=Escherichia coli TaxID=562 RepID=A0A376X627_ECOLX|nr:glutamine synthetase [Escherichia coli]